MTESPTTQGSATQGSATSDQAVHAEDVARVQRRKPRRLKTSAGAPDQLKVSHDLVRTALVIALVTVVFAFLFPNLWYGEHDVSDISIYRDNAELMTDGLLPYRDFDLEYPPLAAPVFVLPGHASDLYQYTRWFSIVMFACTLLCGVTVTLTAGTLWPRGLRPYAAAISFAAAVALTGAIVENRFDMVVALCVAVALLCLTRDMVLTAAAALGAGFALKLTPVVLLPLVLIFAQRPRRALGALGAFTVMAIGPFVPYLVMAPSGVLNVFTYHLERPLQIESVLSTPFLIAKAAGWATVDVVTSYGSQGIAATGTTTVAQLSTVLTALSLVLVYGLIWRRRHELRALPRLLVLAALATVLAGMVFGKVLSPQFVIWLLPLAALVAIDDPWLGGLTLGSLALTQVNFPAKYWALVYLETPAIAWLSARNALLVITFAFAVWRLWRRPPIREALLLQSPRPRADRSAVPGRRRRASSLAPDPQILS